MSRTRDSNGHLGPKKNTPQNKFMVIDNIVYEIKKVVVYEFSMGDVEDPDLYAAEPILKWQNSDEGKWIMERSIETPMWHRMHDQFNYGYRFCITADLKDKDWLHWQMKWKKLTT